jgi:hypothetical protein
MRPYTDVYVIHIPKLYHIKTNRTNKQLKYPEYITIFVTGSYKYIYIIIVQGYIHREDTISTGLFIMIVGFLTICRTQ